MEDLFFTQIVIDGQISNTPEKDRYMELTRILKLTWLSVLPVSLTFGFLYVLSLRLVCQVLKIHIRDPYKYVEPKIRLLSSVFGGGFAALVINVFGMMIQHSLAPPLSWSLWIRSCFVTWIVCVTGIFVGFSLAVLVFGRNALGYQGKE